MKCTHFMELLLLLKKLSLILLIVFGLIATFLEDLRFRLNYISNEIVHVIVRKLRVN